MNKMNKDTTITFRVSQEEKEMIKKLALEYHMSLSQFIIFKVLTNK